MIKRILSLFVAFCMVLPIIQLEMIWAAEVNMPEMRSISRFSTNVPPSVTTAVLNDKNELWIYSVDQISDAQGNRAYTYDAKSAKCLQTGVKGIAGGNRVLFALKQDGSVICYTVFNKTAVLYGTVMTGIAELSYYSITSTMALDKNGNLHHIYTADQDNLSKTEITQVDSGVNCLFDGGNYLKDGVIWTYSPYTETCEEVYKGKLPSNIEQFWENYQSYYLLTENGDLWGWGNNQVGQLGNGGKYNGQDPYAYFGSYTAEYTTVKIKNSIPEKIMGKVEQVWFEGRQVYVQLKDGTFYTWGDGEPIRAFVDATSGKLTIGEWDYPKN